MAVLNCGAICEELLLDNGLDMIEPLLGMIGATFVVVRLSL
jgi:hypothetical protein